MQMGLQPRVLKKQGTSKQTHESEGERLGAKCRHRNYGHKTQLWCLLPIGEDDVFQCIAWVVCIEQSFSFRLSVLLES